MGAKRYEMRSLEDRRRRQLQTAAQPKCKCRNVLGRDNRSGMCGACNLGDLTKDEYQVYYYREHPEVFPQEVQARDLGHALQKIAARLSNDCTEITVWKNPNGQVATYSDQGS